MTEMDCTCGPHQTSYWKLSCPKHTKMHEALKLMPAQNFCPRSARKPHVISLLHQRERGLLSYDFYRKDQLLEFVANRGLTQDIPKKTKRTDMVAMLEKADSEGVLFGRFMNLPPELRVRVFELYFTSFGVLDGPAQPPITKTSKAIREESLPLFYQNLRLDVKFSASIWGITNYQLRPDTSLTNFITSVGNEHLSRLRHLNFGFSGPNPSRVHSWVIDVSADRSSFVIRGERLLTVSEANWEVEEAKVKEVLRKIAPRPGQPILLPDDFRWIGDALLTLLRDPATGEWKREFLW